MGAMRKAQYGPQVHSPLWLRGQEERA